MYFVHRFRATFGKARLFTTGEKVYICSAEYISTTIPLFVQVLVAFSGGMNSRVLLGLAEEVGVGLNTCTNVETLTVISCHCVLVLKCYSGIEVECIQKAAV